MILIEETTVPDGALPVEELKAHLRLGTSFGQETLQDGILQGFLRAAIAAIEARTGKVLIERRFQWSLHAWRGSEAQVLPVAPVAALAGLVLCAPDGAETPVPLANVWLERDAQRPRLRAKGAALPTIPEGWTMRVGLDAGYGAEWPFVPADLRHAVMMLAAHYYEYRDDTALSEGCMPFGVSSLIERYRTLRLGAGAVR